MMRKRLVALLLAGVFCIATMAVAFAASCDGRIWTGKPTIFGTGYYCTAAKNMSDPVTDLNWAKASSSDSSGKVIASASAIRDNTAVANSGSIKPYSGEGSWGITGYQCGGSSSFHSSAWD